VVAPLHAFDPTRPPLFDETLVQGHLSFSYTLFDGGGRSARIRGAEAGEGAALEGEREAAMVLTARVCSAFLGVLSARDVVEASIRQRAALEAELERVRQFLQEGKAARVDLLRVQAALSRAQAAEISAGSDLEVAEGSLARLTGMGAGTIRSGDLVRVRLTQAATPGWEEALTVAQSGSPALVRARRELAAAEAGARLAKAAWLPRLEAGGRITDYGTLNGDHTQEWQAAVSLAYPLFTGGARSGEVARARADEARAREGVRLLELEVADGLEQALAGFAETHALREALQTGVDQSAEVARIEALALDTGSGVQTDFLRAEAELFQARAALAQARNGEILARIELARIMGELTLDWLRDNVETER
jgi:outer membrane protein TolC